MSSWRNYGISVIFRAPLSFAFDWCTDYTPDDGKYAGEDKSIHLRRRIISKSRRRVVFENLYDVPSGWGWERHRVNLLPPNRWHCEGRGNYHESVLDYRLIPLSRNRTRLEMRWKSRPAELATGPRPSRQAVERAVANLWKRRARALERDFRKISRTN